MKKTLLIIMTLLFTLSVMSSCLSGDCVSTVSEQSDNISIFETSQEESEEEKTIVGGIDENGFILTPFDADGCNVCDVKFYTESEIIVSYRNDTDHTSGFMLYDIYSGEKTASYELPLLFSGDIVLYDGGAFALTSSEGIWVRFTSIGDKEPQLVNLSSPRGEEESCDSYIFRQDGSYYYCSGSKITFTDGSGTTVIADCGSGLSYCDIGYVSNGFLYYTGYPEAAPHEIIFAYSESNGTTKAIGNDIIYKYKAYGGIRLYKDYDADEVLVYDPDEPYLVRHISLEQSKEQIVYADDGRIMTSSQEYDDASYLLIGDTFRVYDISGNMLACGVVPDAQMTVCASLCGDLAAIVTSPVTEDGLLDCTLLLYNVNNEPPERTQSEAAQRQRAAGKAYELGCKYGITILTGEEAILDFPDFTAESEQTENILFNALENIETALSRFPDGFFDELLAPTEENEYTPTSLIVSLTGWIRPLNEYSTHYPIAYSYTEDGKAHIVIDVLACTDELLIQTFAHETMHIIDTKILWLTDDDFDGFGSWTSLVPDGAYNFSYVDDDGNDFSGTKYTPDGSGTTYFIDAYSRTFPIEDRARLFEYLFVSEDELFPAIAQNEHVLSRAAVLCGVLREAFESVKSCDDVWWERFIKDEIPE